MHRKTSSMFLARTMIVLCVSYMVVCRGEWEARWSRKAAEEAEDVADIPCSGHGRAYLDGFVLNGHHTVCECNSCYAGSDCSMLLSNCSADAQGGDPLFMEPFWMQYPENSAVLVSGWHRMSYSFSDGSIMSKVLIKHIRKLHDIVGNAITKGRYIVFGNGSVQLFNAAIYALSFNSSNSPAKVVVTPPYYPVYSSQTQLFNSRNCIYEGDASLWKNTSNRATRFIEFVTSPNNPDGKLNKGVLDGPNVKTIYDRVYYWPHYTAIPSATDEEIMLFSLSKLTGHAATRFGWAIVKDEAVYEKMYDYVYLNTNGASRDAQLRALKLISMILKGNGRDIFQFAYSTTRDRWMRIGQIISKSKRFSLQEISPQYCSYFKTIRDPSPAYAWLKCERHEDENCYEILRAGGIIGRPGNLYGVDDHYVRLSLIRTQDDFEILINKLSHLVAREIDLKINLTNTTHISL